MLKQGPAVHLAGVYDRAESSDLADRSPALEYSGSVRLAKEGEVEVVVRTASSDSLEQPGKPRLPKRMCVQRNRITERNFADDHGLAFYGRGRDTLFWNGKTHAPS